MVFAVSINGLIALLPVILVNLKMPALLKISENERNLNLRISPIFVASSWCVILSGAFGSERLIEASVIVIALVSASIRVPYAVIFKMFSKRFERAAPVISFAVSVGLSGLCIGVLVPEYELTLLPQSLWLAMAFGVIAFAFWVLFIVLVADEHREMPFASAMNMFACVQELSIIWFSMCFLGFEEFDQPQYIALLVFFIMIVGFISRGTNATVTVFKKYEKIDYQDSGGDSGGNPA